MTAVARQMGDIRVLVCDPAGPQLAVEGDTNDFLSEAWAHEADWVAIPVSRLTPDFFNLRTRLAGGVIQKFVNYRVGLAIVGDITVDLAASKALQDFARESNAGTAVWFVPDLAALEQRLSRGGA